MKSQKIDPKILNEVFEGMALADTEENMIKGGKNQDNSIDVNNASSVDACVCFNDSCKQTCNTSCTTCVACTVCFESRCYSVSTIKGMI